MDSEVEEDILDIFAIINTININLVQVALLKGNFPECSNLLHIIKFLTNTLKLRVINTKNNQASKTKT